MLRKFFQVSALLMALVCLLPSHVVSQELLYVRLEFGNAVIKDNASIKVNIFRNPDATYDLRVESWSWPGADPAKSLNRTLTISKEQFQEIKKVVFRIRQEDILGGAEVSMLDGSACGISYGTLGTSVAYQAVSPNYKTHERKLNDFLHAFELILVTAKLDPKAILN